MLIYDVATVAWIRRVRLNHIRPRPRPIRPIKPTGIQWVFCCATDSPALWPVPLPSGRFPCPLAGSPALRLVSCPQARLLPSGSSPALRLVSLPSGSSPCPQARLLPSGSSPALRLVSLPSENLMPHWHVANYHKVFSRCSFATFGLGMPTCRYVAASAPMDGLPPRAPTVGARRFRMSFWSYLRPLRGRWRP